MRLFTRCIFLLLLSFFSVFAAKGQVAASFSASPTSGCAPLVVYFTNTSANATHYFWDFGNTTTSYLTNPSSSYLTPGTYTIKLTAYNAAGDSSVYTETITVYPAPTISFIANEYSVCPGEPVTFSSTGSSGVTGSVTYSWNFGDGDTSDLSNPSHSYVVSGYKNVTLSVTNSKGCVASLTVGAYIDVYTPPLANFSAVPPYACNTPALVSFTNASTGAGPMTYTWSFGDGGTSTATSPTHTYTATGTYSIQLIVTDSHGCKDTLTRTDYVTVGSLTGSFTAPTSACVYSPVFFDNTTTTTGVSSTWYFGTGATSTATSPTYTYNTAGTYTVSLVISNGYCQDTIQHVITILPEPTSNFTWTPTDPCPAPAAITYNSTVPAGSTVTWEYGDGYGGTGISSSHTYSGDGAFPVTMIVTNSSGCKDTVEHIDSIFNLVINISHLIDSSGCVPLTIPFVGYAISTVPISEPYPYGVAAYSWNFGDGSPISTSATPTHTYTAVGVYTVTYTVVTSNGCSQTTTKVIRVGTPPVANFTAAPTTICADRYVSFSNTSTGADSYMWYFGDGSSTIIPDPTHEYTMPDTFYTVMLIAYYNGCPDTLIRPLYITVDSPKAIIAAAHVCVPANEVIFGDSSLGDNQHLWSFGDGSTSTLSNPIHSYSALSTYTVTLTTYNIASGCRDTTSEILSLVRPAPAFTTSDTAVCKNSIVHFTPSVTGGTAEVYAWYANGIYKSADSIFTDTFTVTGLYTITLAIEDQNHCWDTLAKNNYMTVAKPADSFSVSPPTGCAPLTVIYTDHSTDAPGVTFTNFTWAFGDGGTASVSTPSTPHTYTTAGTFAVEEIVTDNIGCKDTITLPSQITVYKPAASFYSATTYPCIGVPVNFTNLSTGVVSYFWMFGDGGTSTVYSPTYSYSAIGNYTVKLVVTDVHGCTDTASYPAYIHVTRPDASFYMTDSFSLCPPLSVDFINTSTGSTSYQWYFGDGSSSILVSPSNLYITTEYDTVLLIAKNSYGCPDTAIGHVNLFGSSGGFTYTPLSGCVPLTVHFSATINNVPNIIWDFADGTTTAAAFSDTASHTYTIPGAYVPKLVLSDNTGCEKSSQGIDTIKVDAVKAGFTEFPGACLDMPFIFKDTSSSFFSTINSWHWTITPTDTTDISGPTYIYTAIGTYPVTLVVADAWGCKDSITEEVTVAPPPIITVSSDTTVCVGDPADLTGYGGVSYTWAPPATLSCTACTTTQATPAVVTQYTVTGTDAHGCQSTDTVSVFLRTKTFSNGWGDTSICQTQSVTLFDTGGSKYTWTPSTWLNNPNSQDPIATPNATTTYTVIAQLGSCIPDINYVTIIVYPLPTVNAGNDQTAVAGSQVQLQATGTGIASYSWLPVQTLSCETCSDPIATAGATTTYTVDVSSSFGCRASDSVTIHVFCDKSQVFIPNSFTPNGDGENDVFYPRGTGISIIKSFRIYNRWGELLFERSNITINDASNAWDGTFNGATPRPDVYVYIVDAVCETGENINLKGDVTIIR